MMRGVLPEATVSVWPFGVRRTNISFLLFHVPMVWYARIVMMIMKIKSKNTDFCVNPE